VGPLGISSIKLMNSGHLNIASFLPVQSQYYPLISIYFLMSLIWTFLSLVWFWYSNKLLTENKIPSSLRVVAKYVKKCLFFIFIPAEKNQAPHYFFRKKC
jgi:hypothetical protein